jgi:hypothetical protein
MNEHVLHAAFGGGVRHQTRVTALTGDAPTARRSSTSHPVANIQAPEPISSRPLTRAV